MSNTKEIKKPIYLFIDTNILLDFYRYSKNDLAKLNQLEALIVKTGDINLIVTSHQVDEFYRNRDKVIAVVLKDLNTTLSMPELFSGHPEYLHVKQQVEAVKADVERIKEETIEDARQGKLKADAIISRLLKDAIEVDQKIYDKAKMRSVVGNPPGKPGSIGDAINWEILLKEVPINEELHIVTEDGDYKSSLNKLQLNSFLEREWHKGHMGDIHLHETLNSLFKSKFKHIRLMGEYIKSDLIRQLHQSLSFNDSRKIIERMLHAGSYSEKQIRDTYYAALSNDQVYNAHKFSPDLIGTKLRTVLKPYWNTFSQEEQTRWMTSFPDNEVEAEDFF